MTIGEKIMKRRIELAMSQEELAKKVGYKDRSSIARIESGERDIRQSSVVKFAEALSTTPAWLMDISSDQQQPTSAPSSNVQPLPACSVRMIPCFDSVSAGFGAFARDSIVDYIPIFIESEQEAADTICVRVCGDSMHPRIEDGDIVQVHKQETAENGDIVVILDGSTAYVKRFIRGKNGVILESFNPAYPPMHFTKLESNELRIVGVVKRIIRDV
jgi:repressor LexA